MLLFLLESLGLLFQNIKKKRTVLISIFLILFLIIKLNFRIFAGMKAILFFACLFNLTLLHAQHKYWIYFNGNQEIKGNPQLSDRAIKNRSDQKISLTKSDYPISSTYTLNLQNVGIKIENYSRWMNAVSAYLSDEQLSTIQNFYFIKKIERVKIWKRKNDNQLESKTSGYGNSQYQINLFNLMPLHQQGFTGKNVRIGVFDSGFKNANLIKAFDSLRVQNRIKKVYDFVNQDTTVWDEDSHGTGVLSCITGYSEDTLIGSGYHAEVVLARTETVASETVMEEDNWVAAMEWADSLGVDIISTSLGYSEFDSGTSHTYQDLDGNKTVIAIGADEAAKRGIIVVVSAGNEGGNAWYHITTPCDADSALCVGAVNAVGTLASFSSIGPSADGQIKPDICAMGQGVTIANQFGGYQFSNGTSFACPLAAGMAACLKQANPTKNNMEIINAIRMSSSNAWFPDSACGYGIPNAMKADSILKGFVNIEKNTLKSLINLAYEDQGFRIIGLENFKNIQVACWDVKGQNVVVWNESEKTVQMNNQVAGLYLLEIKTEQGIWSKKVIWKP